MRDSWWYVILASVLIFSAGGVEIAQAQEDSESKNAEKSEDESGSEEQDGDENEEDEEDEASLSDAETDVESESGRRIQSGDKNWSVGLTITSQVGQGTFADAKNDTGTPGQYQPLSSSFDQAALGYSLSASYNWQDIIFSAGIGWTQGLSPGVGVEDPQQIWFNDTSLTANWTGYTIEPIDTKVSANLGFGFPTGLTSRTTTKIMDVDASASIRRTFFKRLTLAYSLGGGKGFHNYKVPAIDVDQVGEGNYLYERNLDRGLAAIQGVNKEWSMSNSFRASVRVWSKLSASLSYSYSRNWSYDRDVDDQYQSPIADSGRGVQDRISTRISLRYPFAEYFTVQGGLYSSTFPKTSDQRSMNFPFWNFSGAANNQSGFNLAISATY